MRRRRRWGQWWIVASTSAAAHTVVEAEQDQTGPKGGALSTDRKESAVDFETGP